MSNRYILDTSGKIIKIDATKKINASLGTIEGITFDTESEVPKESSYYNEKDFDGNETYLGSFRKDGAGSSYGSMGAAELTFINDTTNNNNIIKSLTDENPSFGFIGQNGEETSVVTKQFRQYNNANVISNEDGKPLPFVNEFEFYSGFTDPVGEDNNPGLESLNLLVNYFVSVVVEAAVIESLIAIYKWRQDSSTIQGNRLDTNKKFLVMGEYILDEVDVFNRYFFDVINYPIEEKSVGGTYFLKRLACYFIGLNEWLSHDRVFSWERFFNVDNVPIIGSLNADLKAILEKTVDITLSNFSNASSLKRILLLVKKFNTQKYWVNEQLYRFKSKNTTDVITDIYNYYYFKFFIERVNVGIKIYNRIYAEDSVKKLVNTENLKTNRISQDFNKENHFVEININDNTQSANVKDLIADLAVNNITGQELTGAINKIKENLSNAQNIGLGVDYHFKQSFKGMSIKSIPSALMFNRKSLKRSSYNYNVQNQYFAKTNNNYLPTNLVKEIEKKLETEYMPFYFHDLRTNELLSFHAFIENISDSYSPEYTATSGFGRIDDVRTYVKTTRSISLSFVVAAMNKSDYETMWYYLNKLVSMVYPQWSKGEDLILDKFKIEQPFSQVPTNSPLIRLRLGDLIKNNYSRFNLSRLFGIQNKKVMNESIDNSDINWSKLNIAIDSELQKLNAQLSAQQESVSDSSQAVSSQASVTNLTNNDLKPILIMYDNKYYFAFYKSDNDTKYVKLTESYFTILEKTDVLNLAHFNSLRMNSDVKIINYSFDEVDNALDIENNSIEKTNYNLIMKPFNDDKTINNPITQSYESRMSKGLAGHITSLDFNYSDANWEIEEYKAPMMVKVTLNFAPIHDIPPGLDENGMMRAANYNIGDLNKEIFGDLEN